MSRRSALLAICLVPWPMLVGSVTYRIDAISDARTTYTWGGDPRFDCSDYIGGGGVDRVIPGLTPDCRAEIARIVQSALDEPTNVARIGKIGDSRPFDNGFWTWAMDLGFVADSTGYNWSAMRTYTEDTYYILSPNNTSGTKYGNNNGWRLADMFTNAAWDSFDINTDGSVCFIYDGVNDCAALVLADTTAWGDSLAAVGDSLVVRGALPVLMTINPSAFTSQGSVFNGGGLMEINRQIRRVSGENNWPCLDTWALFMDTAAELRAARPSEFPNDSTAIFGHGTTPDSGLVKFSDHVHLTSSCNGCPGGGNGRNMSTRALKQTNGHSLCNLLMFQFMDFMQQIGEPSN